MTMSQSDNMNGSQSDNMNGSQSDDINGSWFFDENFNGVSDDFFDDVIKYFDFPLEDVDVNNVGEDWDASFQNLEPPPANVLAGLSSDFAGDFCNINVDVKKGLSLTYNGTSQLQQRPSIYEPSSSRSTFIRKSTNGKDSRLFQTSSPVSVLESSNSCSAENPRPFDPKLVFLVKRTRSKRRRPSTFNQRFLFPFISALSASRESDPWPASDSESESQLAEKTAKKKQKKRRNLTLLSSSTETKKSPSEQPVATRKCMHCEVTKTPQWREGPMGPKTLCNACGVRYRSGRLLPEYRPAASPTFVPTLHSNSHKKVVEMRKKDCGQVATMGVTRMVTQPPSEDSYG